MTNRLRAWLSSDGVLGWHCPGCGNSHGVPVQASEHHPSPWQWNGSSESPTLSPSVLTQSGPGTRCHSFVRDGRIEYLSDCDHGLAGKTVEIPADE